MINHSESTRFLTIANLTKIYLEGNNRLTVLEDASLEVPAGQFVVLLGRSGSGKSTLLHLIAGIDTPTSGSIQVNDQKLTELSEKERHAFPQKTHWFHFSIFQPHSHPDGRGKPGPSAGTECWWRSRSFSGHWLLPGTFAVGRSYGQLPGPPFRRGTTTSCHCACADSSTRVGMGRRTDGQFRFRNERFGDRPVGKNWFEGQDTPW